MVESEEGLRISLPDQTDDFHSGDSLTLQILVTQLTSKGEKPINGAAVSLKVLGTAFRPLIYSVKTNREGVATVSTEIPQFTSGRAAILIRAEAGELSSETRRVSIRVSEVSGRFAYSRQRRVTRSCGRTVAPRPG